MHGELPSDLPEGDVLIIAGDLLPVYDHSLEYQYDWVDQQLAPYLAGLPHKTILIVGGNHDFLLEAEPIDWWRTLPRNVRYLQDSWTEVDGVQFWGSPWSPTFFDWAFMDTDAALGDKYQAIPHPDEIDVMISHGPPLMAGDRNREGKHCGSASLRTWVVEHQPKYVISGHIHEAYGSYKIDHTNVFNVSYMDRDYEPANAQVVFEL